MALQAKPASQSEVIMTELVLPGHTNALGSIFGGQIMSWVDIAAAIAAQRHSGQICVTANIDDLHFIAPVYKGWVVNLKAQVNYVHKTSMEIGVRVDAENPMQNQWFHTASAYLTFVALDPQGKPVEIPPLLLDTDEAKRRHAAAIQRREFRLKRRAIK